MSAMPAPASPAEPSRLLALQRYQVLDTPPEPGFDDLTQIAAHVYKTPISLVSLIDGNRQWFKARVGLEAEETSRDLAFCAHAILQRKVFVVEDTLNDARFATNPLVTAAPNIRFYAGVPLVTPDNHALGTLCVIDREPRHFAPEEFETLSALARQVMAQMELRRHINDLHRSNASLIALATTDPLTGLHNVRNMRALLEQEFVRASQMGSPLSLIMLDVDHFKAYNDTFGHTQGDDVLKTIADILGRSLRAGDHVARYSGEEFAIILPDSDRLRSGEVAERLREAVADYPWSQRAVTVSLGVASVRPFVASPQTLLSLADKALYQSKENGRNCVTHSLDMGGRGVD